MVAIARAELRVGGEKVEDWVVVGFMAVVVEAFERSEWARRVEKKLAKKERLVGILVLIEMDVDSAGSAVLGKDEGRILWENNAAVLISVRDTDQDSQTCRCLA